MMNRPKDFHNYTHQLNTEEDRRTAESVNIFWLSMKKITKLIFSILHYFIIFLHLVRSQLHC